MQRNHSSAPLAPLALLVAIVGLTYAYLITTLLVHLI